jgi:hypothetical protein
MKSLLLSCFCVLIWTGSTLAQTKPAEVVRCAPDSVVNHLLDLMSGLQFKRDSSDIEFVPDSGTSDLAAKAQVIRDVATCRRAHQAFLRDAVESESDPNRVAVARVGPFYFIYEDDSELAVVDRKWKHVTVFGYGL